MSGPALLEPAPTAAGSAPATVGLLYDRFRPEERMLVDALERLDVPYRRLYAPDLVVEVGAAPADVDVVLDRCLSQTRALSLLRAFEAAGAITVNASSVVATCGDKLATASALAAATVPQPRSGVAFTPEGARELAAGLGWPVVCKPLTGSWGRMVSRVNDEDALEAIIEHKRVLGGPEHKVIFLQEYVEKPGRDLRAFVIGGRCVAAIERRSEHWITNTARGAEAVGRPLDAALSSAAEAAAAAVGGGAVAVDLIESSRGLLVNEVNHTMEFRNSVDTTGVDLPGLLARHAAAAAVPR